MLEEKILHNQPSPRDLSGSPLTTDYMNLIRISWK